MTFSAPVYVDREGTAVTLERIKLQAASGSDDSQFDESWLQEFLFAHPQSIPFRDIDPTIGTVVPVCREMPTPAGPVDLVYVTDNGKIVLVETKLYRNPEARRTVIGQILDYAKELTNWRYEQFAALVASASKGSSDTLLRSVRSVAPHVDQARFVDSINRSLSRADMTLLIVGDGIQTGAEALVDFLERHGGLQFSLGLIEVSVFGTPGGGRFIQPRILAKTELLRRTLLIGASDGASVPEAAPEETIGDLEPTWQQQFWAQLLNRLKLNNLSQPVPPKPPRGPEAYFPMPPKGSAAWITAYVSSGKSQLGVYLLIVLSYANAAALIEGLMAQKAEIEREIGTPLDWDRTAKSYLIAARRPYEDLEEPIEREAQLVFLSDTINRFVNTFRPRLEALHRESSIR